MNNALIGVIVGATITAVFSFFSREKNKKVGKK